MKNGNGHGGPFRLRSLLSALGQDRPEGPFSGADIVGVLKGLGWRAEPPQSSAEWLVFRHEDDLHAVVVVNPDWAFIYEEDATFRTLRRDLGLSRDELLDRLRGEQRGREGDQ